MDQEDQRLLDNSITDSDDCTILSQLLAFGNKCADVTCELFTFGSIGS